MENEFWDPEFGHPSCTRLFVSFARPVLKSVKFQATEERLVFSYGSRAAVADYYNLVGESESCWYIVHDSEQILEAAAHSVTTRNVYLK